MGLLFTLLSELLLKRKRDRVKKIYKEIGKNETILELTKDDPEMQENLRTLGIQLPDTKKPTT